MEILREQESSSEMTILEYLQRLNLDKWALLFAKKNILFVTDLRHFKDPRQFSQNFDLKEDSKRLSSMMEGDKKTQEDFALLTKNHCRQIIRRFINNNELVEKLVECIPDDTISGHVLKDIMATNFIFDQIKCKLDQKIKELTGQDTSVAINILIQPGHDLINDKDEEQEKKDKKKFIGHPTNDIESLLKEFQCEDAIEKIKEHDMDDEQFWNLKKDELKSMLDI